jgi:hypothetical protein
MTTTLSLQGLQGQVLRLRGVVDRVGGYQQQGRVLHTLCVRALELASTSQPINPDHWWFRLRQTWTEAGVQAGDTVVFTAKVRTFTKGSHDPERWENTVRVRERVVGLGGDVRDLVILRRGPAQRLLLDELEGRLVLERRLREEAEGEAQRLVVLRDALITEMERLQDHLATWKARCRILDPGVANDILMRAPRGPRHGRGFQNVDRLLPRQRSRAMAA